MDTINTVIEDITKSDTSIFMYIVVIALGGLALYARDKEVISKKACFAYIAILVTLGTVII